jgi:DtxR family Mn-dependent transcriptional regulator
VHEVAEQLEHIQSKRLIEKLDEFLEYPKTDPHGDPIPDAAGKIIKIKQVHLSEFPVQKKCAVCAVKNDSPSFLQYLSKIGIGIGAILTIVDKVDFDGSLEISADNKKRIFISKEAAENLLVTE